MVPWKFQSRYITVIPFCCSIHCVLIRVQKFTAHQSLTNPDPRLYRLLRGLEAQHTRSLIQISSHRTRPPWARLKLKAKAWLPRQQTSNGSPRTYPACPIPGRRQSLTSQSPRRKSRLLNPLVLRRTLHHIPLHSHDIRRPIASAKLHARWLG
jgi:hypothetical protein